MISILVPSRGRPDQLAALWASACETAKHPIEIIYRLDSDDPQLANYSYLRPGVKLIGPRIVLSEMWNECARAANYDIMMHCGDDIRFRTAEWDVQVIAAFEAYPDHIVFVHGRDGIHDARMGTHGFLHRQWIEAVGSFVPPYFSSDYNDQWLSDVADLLGRRHFIPAVYTEHMHPVAGKGEWDLTHRERLERGREDNVDALYASLAAERLQWVDRLRGVMASG